MRCIPAAAAVLALLALSPVTGAPLQGPCALEALRIPAATDPIAFTPEQEMHLGDAIAEHVQRSLGVIDDPVNDYLQAIGDRIVAELPPTGLTFRFRLVEQPFWSAFAMPGGRVYVTRKLVAYVRSEDELAGVLAHEVGHLVARHSAAELTMSFERDLGVTSFGDRADIFEKYGRLVDARRRGGGNAKREHRQQLEADAAALIAAARAGYSPDAYVDLWDRYTETEGRVGNFFSDLFGATRPESRRLREMIRTMAAIPRECRRSRADDGRFAVWQRRVTAYDGAGASGTPADTAARRVTLLPPLRPDITHLEFSPDGRWVIAQDDSGVAVLARDPFALRFRIDLDSARPAQFTPDSRQILVHTRSQRVERWDVAAGQRLDVVELDGKRQCLETRLSPDGRLLGCVDVSFDVLLLAVPTGEVRFRKPRAYTIDFDALVLASRDRNARLNFDVFHLEFTPDGRYFVVGGPAGEVVVDLESMSEGGLPDRMRKAFRGSFDFLGADRVVTVDPVDGRRSSIVSYPGGAPERQVALGSRITAATRGDFVVVRPLNQWAAGLVDLAANRVVIASRTPALDVFDRAYISERPTGDIALYELGQGEPTALAILPDTTLGPPGVFDVSPDLRYLALSGRDRGAVWDLTSGKRVVFVRGFAGAFIAPDGGMYTDFPSRREVDAARLVEVPRRLVRVDLPSSNTRDLTTLTDDDASIVGRYITSMSRTSKSPDRRELLLEVRDATSNALVWTRRFEKDRPRRVVVDRLSDRMAIVWPARSDAARQLMKEMAADRGTSAKPAKEDVVVEAIAMANRAPLGWFLVPGGDVGHVSWAGDLALVTDRDNQVTVYSLASGEARGSVFGSSAVASERAGLLCVQNDRRAVDLYDLATLERRTTMRLPAAVRLARFDADGRRLLVLTADQQVRFYDVAAIAAAP